MYARKKESNKMMILKYSSIYITFEEHNIITIYVTMLGIVS